MSPSSNNKGKILFIPICSQGHVNFCITISKKFLEKYAEFADIYFAVDLEFKNKLEKICDKINYIVYDPPKWGANPDSNKSDVSWIVELFQKFGQCWKEDPLEQNRNSAPTFEQAFDSLKLAYPILTDIINELKPDFLIFDQLFTVPIGIDQNIPYANLFSGAMNFTGLSKVMPPPGSGLPSIKTPENVKKWEEFIEKAYKTGPFLKLHDNVNQFLHDKKTTVNLDDQYFVFAPSKYLNIYCYPKELDFKEDFPNDFPHKWMRIDSPILKPYPQPYAIPEKLKNKPGKLIYFSLGSMASSYKPLMNKMLDALSKTNHRYIVSTGLIGEEYKLSDNMHGEKYVNQFSVLQTVEMIISHGGNNTLTESFHFGVPLIFVPLFGDQRDNAQRVQDKGYGVRCNIHAPPEVLKQQLEDGIEYCSKESVKLKMKKASVRIQQNSGVDDVCDELLKYVKK